MKKVFLSIVCVFFALFSNGQRMVTFMAEDSLKVTAELYTTYSQTSNYMLLFHQAEYSRGEFEQIATRLIKLNYNCLAVDLRYGNGVNFINNETAMLARTGKYANSMVDCEKDIIAAIDFIYSMDSTAQIFLLGSSFSGSLCLKVAKDREDIKAVIAYSPGEFFSNFKVSEYITGLETPCYIGCARPEYSYITEIAKNIASPKKVIFRPENSNGEHGAKALWWNSNANEEYWLSLLFFLKDYK